MSGAATPEELAAVLAALSARRSPPAPTPYEQWRQRRQDALLRTPR